MDVNRNPLHNNLYRQIGGGADGVAELTHECWGPTPPQTHARGSAPIDGGYKSQEIEIVNLFMLNFADSPGDHRSLILDVSTCSMFGEKLNKICKPVSRRLITSQRLSVMRYNKIVQEQCIIHQIQEQMYAIDRLTSYYGYPVPKWLEVRMVKVHSQLTEIRQHAEKKCRKIQTPACKFSPPVKLWYDRIHAFRQLIRLH